MPKAENREEWNRTAMEQMSTDGLEELLRQDFHTPKGGEADMSGLYHAAQVLAALCGGGSGGAGGLAAVRFCGRRQQL